MSEISDAARPPLGIRLLAAVGKEPDWTELSAEDLASFASAQNRKRSSSLARLITGFPDRGAVIRWRELALAGRRLRVRVYRPKSQTVVGADAQLLPVVVHVHGGGFVGTAAQSDWVNSYLAARLPAMVVSVEHRLLAPGTPISAAVDDGWDVLKHVIAHAAQWRVDRTRAAVFGESTGGAVAALAAIRARDAGLMLRGQVLVNACLDLTQGMFEHESIVRHSDSPTLTMSQMQFFAQLAVPPGSDALAVSPLQADDLSGLPPALVVVPTVDPAADHGRRYFDRLVEAGTSARKVEFSGATHAFLSMPGLVPQARPARAEVFSFLREQFKQPATEPECDGDPKSRNTSTPRSFG
jgi:acetyl esterase